MGVKMIPGLENEASCMSVKVKCVLRYPKGMRIKKGLSDEEHEIEL